MNYYTKIEGVILWGAIGDVLGSTYEGINRQNIERNEITSRIESYTNLENNDTNKYTDDTEMTMIIAQYLTDHHRIDKVKIHRRYQKVMLSSHKGYSSSTRNIITDFDPEISQLGTSSHNGALMRISPMAFFNKCNDATLQHEIKNAIFYTHGGNDDALETCFIHVKFLQAIMEEKFHDKYDILPYLFHKCVWKGHLYDMLMDLHTSNLLDKFDINFEKKFFKKDLFKIKAIECFITALYVFIVSGTNEWSALKNAISLGGDTDTVAQVLGTMLGARHGNVNLPQNYMCVEDHDKIKTISHKMLDYQNLIKD